MSGGRKVANLSTCEMFSKQRFKIYRCIMRFKFLINCLRFDNKNIRDRENKFSTIREYWNLLIRNCTESYAPHTYCTMEEQLLEFKEHCPFRVYISSKADKYGLKIVTRCDSRSQ